MPPLLAPEKLASCYTRMDTLGWTIDTVTMTISVPSAVVSAAEGVAAPQEDSVGQGIALAYWKVALFL